MQGTVCVVRDSWETFGWLSGCFSWGPLGTFVGLAPGCFQGPAFGLRSGRAPNLRAGTRGAEPLVSTIRDLGHPFPGPWRKEGGREKG